MSVLKILVCGDVEGRFAVLSKKIESLHSKRGPFECLFCVGNFFGSNNDEWPDVLSGKIKFPFTTYVLGPNKKEHAKFYPKDSCDLANNIIYLGKQGVLTGSSGLKIVYLSGQEQLQSNEFSFSTKDVSRLINSITDQGIDILLTSQCPTQVTKHAVPLEAMESANCSSAVAYVAKCVKPRYHFSGLSGCYYERLPYRNHQILQETAVQFTRFISLAPVVNSENLKWLYAFNITPFRSLPFKELTKPGDGPITESPYDGLQLKDMMEEENNQFFYAGRSESEKRSKKEDKPFKKQKTCPVAQEDCWFCFTNPKLEKQLLLSIGEHSYLTLAKGGIVSQHLLIIPMEHIPASVDLPEDAEKEINNYKNALVKYFHNFDHDVVFFERHFMSAHLQIQVVPIPNSRSNRLMHTIKEFAVSQGMEFTEVSKFSVIRQMVPPKKSFFHVEVFTNQESKGNLLYIITGKFPLQFGRMMLASKNVLNTPDRIDWRECKMPPDEEMDEAEQFRNSFKRYDFTKI